MKRAIAIFLIILLSFIFSCTGNKASELFETAKFEELQNNKEHARELYEELLKQYPESEYAGKAKERLAVLREGGKSR